jgi:glycerol-1-phosphatase
MRPGPTPVPAALSGSDGALVERYDLMLVDLDGVAYLGDRPIDGAAEALSAARAAGVGLVFVTNNASRPPGVVAEQLSGMGVAAEPVEVMTSSIAAARELAGRLAPGTAVLVVGGEGVRDAVLDAGLRPVFRADQRPAAVLQGFGPEVGWAELAEASVALRAGAEWIATNTDATLPSPRGPLPGNGSLVAALITATGRQPEVIGKPAPALFTAALNAAEGTRPLVVGDRLDTDIAGARAAALPSLMVLTGVSTARDAVYASPPERPDFIGHDLRALHADPSTLAVGPHPAWHVEVTQAQVTVRATGAAADDDLSVVRALAQTVWESGARSVAAGDDTARAALQRWSLLG